MKARWRGGMNLEQRALSQRRADRLCGPRLTLLVIDNSPQTDESRAAIRELFDRERRQAAAQAAGIEVRP